jgi:hypothetical protein
VRRFGFGDGSAEVHKFIMFIEDKAGIKYVFSL